MANPTYTAADVDAIAQPRESYSKDFAELKRLLRSRGLLEKDPKRYLLKFIEPFVMIAVATAMLIGFSNFGLQLLSVPFFVIGFVRAGFMMHDTGHRQVFPKPRANELVGLIYGNVILGSSISSWRERHNEHHAHTN
ncbi:MAG: hypothetical protein GYB68_03295, partial [Chloroflexi bacterium]|nr:hypothetical protein [Chloroflexota bacterium]